MAPSAARMRLLRHCRQWTGRNGFVGRQGMDLMTPELWTMLGTGAFLGFLMGRSSAERGRARADARKVMKSRSTYRKS